AATTPQTETYMLSLHDALPIWDFEIELLIDRVGLGFAQIPFDPTGAEYRSGHTQGDAILRRDRANVLRALHPDSVSCQQLYTLRSEEHTSELQSRENLVCRLLL